VLAATVESGERDRGAVSHPITLPLSLLHDLQGR
jgi:hypothetical protein